MKKLFILLSIATLLFIGCEKDETESCTKAKARFTCTSNNPYNLYIDGVFEKSIPGSSYYEIYLTAGFHYWKLEQASGYILYPTVINDSKTVIGCSDFEYVFP